MLLVYLRVAARNVLRNTRRSLITALGVSLGIWMILISKGVLNGLQAGMIRGITETRMGDMQLHAPGWAETAEAAPLSLSISQVDDLRSFLLKDPRITDAAARVQFTGLISSGENTSLFFGIGMEPEHEYNICRYQQENIIRGTAVRADHPKDVVVARDLADALGLQLGSEITLVATTAQGALNGVDLNVVGVIEYRMPGAINRSVQLPLATAQRLLRMDGLVNEVILDSRDLEEVPAIQASLQQRLVEPGGPGPLEVITWQEASPDFVAMIEEQNGVLKYIVAVFYVIMISGIANTMLMSVFERTVEVGTLMALGVRRRKIVGLFMLEGLLLGLMGAILGTGVSLLCFGITDRYSLPIPPLGESTQWINIYPYVKAPYFVQVIVIAIGVALVAALYPALRASRLRPSEALSGH
jgi:putative ABC transport system permease protein